MKKIFALLLTCLLCLSAVGCSEKPYSTGQFLKFNKIRALLTGKDRKCFFALSVLFS